MMQGVLEQLALSETNKKKVWNLLWSEMNWFHTKLFLFQDELRKLVKTEHARIDKENKKVEKKTPDKSKV